MPSMKYLRIPRVVIAGFTLLLCQLALADAAQLKGSWVYSATRECDEVYHFVGDNRLQAQSLNQRITATSTLTTIDAGARIYLWVVELISDNKAESCEGFNADTPIKLQAHIQFNVALDEFSIIEPVSKIPYVGPFKKVSD